MEATILEALKGEPVKELIELAKSFEKMARKEGEEPGDISEQE